MTTLELYRTQLRDKAVAFQNAQAVATPGWEQIILALWEFICRLLAGALAGAQAGYVSHLVMDAATPASLPLLCRGF